MFDFATLFSESLHKYMDVKIRVVGRQCAFHFKLKTKKFNETGFAMWVKT